MKGPENYRTQTDSIRTIIIAAMILLSIGQLNAAGILTPLQSNHQPIQIRTHQVNVVINNGFAMTEVTQTFFNPNDKDLEAVYSFPLPESASLSEVTIHCGEKEINGEVLAKEKARNIYEEEKSKGNESGLAEKNKYLTFEFAVYPVRSQSETRIRFLYYQPVKIEMGVGRYVYPLQEGGTDESAQNFWTTNDTVENYFSVDVELKSAWPVLKTRAPGFESSAQIQKKTDGHHTLKLEQQKTSLNRDFVFYYRLAQDLPGRVELIPYRADKNKPGTFMMVVTPGMDLKPLNNGADYTFVLDVSGSMRVKLATLVRGIEKVLGEMKDHDRFRIITFNNSASDITGGYVNVTKSNVDKYAEVIKNLSSGGSTNLFAGLSTAVSRLDDDRATSIILVTDAVTNTGVIDPSSFFKLMKIYDVRVFGFLMGNSGNWPLMRTICNASGGFSAGVSNDDDILGQIMLAKSKVVYECMHDSELSISGINVFDATDKQFGKIYRGQQLVIFGKYEHGGKANLKLKGRMTGKDKTYTTTFDFPDINTENPEIERLWALNRIEHLEDLANMGQLPHEESRTAVRDLGTAYQLVTDETSMVVLSDETFAKRNIERKNQKRIETERTARVTRAQNVQKNKTAQKSKSARKPQNVVRSHRVDTKKPMFKRKSPGFSLGGGGGAFDPFSAGILIGAAALAGSILRRSKQKKNKE